VGGSNHARLHAVLIRLRGGTLDVTDHKIRYFGGLIEGGFRDEITLNYEVTINPKFAVLFGFGMWSKIDLEKRRALGRNNTAKAIYGYYATHINPTAHKFETLANLAGLTNSNKRQTKAARGFCAITPPQPRPSRPTSSQQKAKPVPSSRGTNLPPRTATAAATNQPLPLNF